MEFEEEGIAEMLMDDTAIADVASEETNQLLVVDTQSLAPSSFVPSLSFCYKVAHQLQI